ncbi:jg8169 [Pararge aegeria aegeria]|uniref:Jg8169 protein n=1 Tax=Pararge aegeria aegeria TaxID=348720 RepID=A0A8S4SGI8_9NEOP|nr:jg8169 [Pararge aegeria aegeria]
METRRVLHGHQLINSPLQGITGQKEKCLGSSPPRRASAAWYWTSSAIENLVEVSDMQVASRSFLHR